MDQCYLNKLSRKRRLELGLTQAKVARYIKVSVETYNRWERCHQRIQLRNHRVRLASILKEPKLLELPPRRFIVPKLLRDISDMSVSELNDIVAHIQLIKRKRDKLPFTKPPKRKARGRQEITKMFGARLRKLRDERGMTQEELADKLGTNHGYILQLEKGQHLPGLPLIQKISTYFGLNSAGLFE